MIPLRDNIPSDRFPAVTLAFIVINVLVFLLFQGPSFSFSAGDNVETKPVVEYGAIPYRITHPGDDCDLGVDHGGGDGPFQAVRGGDPDLRGDARVPGGGSSAEPIPSRTCSSHPLSSRS